MNLKSEVNVLGARKGEFTDKETGELIRFFKLSTMKPSDSSDDDTIGNLVTEYSINDEIFNFVKSTFDVSCQSMPYILEFSIQSAGKRQYLKVSGIELF